MLGKIREILWPRLEGEPSVYNSFLCEDIEIEEENLDSSVEFAKIMYEKQKDRVSSVESKSSIYLGFFGTAVAILAFALKDILFLDSKSVLHDITLFLGALLIIYILQVMRYSIQALERRNYHSLDENDFLHGDKRKTVINLINKVKSNYDVINRKVESMTMAHEFTKRILWILHIIALALIVMSLHKYVLLIPEINIVMSAFTLNIRWSDYLLVVVMVVQIVNGIRIRKLELK